jgi:hypothetical protein
MFTAFNLLCDVPLQNVCDFIWWRIIDRHFKSSTKTVGRLFTLLVAVVRCKWFPCWRRDSQRLPARQRPHDGNTPLCLVCKRGTQATVEAVELLINGVQQPATMASNSGRTPLHNACESGAPPNVIVLLVKRGPQALEMVADSGFSVLHLACRSNDSIANFYHLFNRWPVGSLFLATVLEIKDLVHEFNQLYRTKSGQRNA